MSSRGIIVFGASGAGTTTLGRKIARELDYQHIDLDDLSWHQDTELPFSVPYTFDERARLLSEALAEVSKFVLSGSMCGWDEQFVPMFDLAVFIQTPSDVRLKRLRERDSARFKSRIEVGGDLYASHQEFLDWASKYDELTPPDRCLKMHTEWITKLKCPVISVSGLKTVSHNAKIVLERIFQN